MNPEDLEAEELSNGRYVWVLTTAGGANYRGARQYKTRRGALDDGRKWVDGINSARPGLSGVS